MNSQDFPESDRIKSSNYSVEFIRENIPLKHLTHDSLLVCSLEHPQGLSDNVVAGSW